MGAKHISEILEEISINPECDVSAAEKLMDDYESKKGKTRDVDVYLDRARTLLERASLSGVYVHLQLTRLIDLERNSWD